jgi:hypothetical protein
MVSNDHHAYGSLYQWGRYSDGHELMTWTSGTSGTAVNGTTSTNATTDTPGHADFITEQFGNDDWRDPQNDNLWQGVSGINNPCPQGWRVPTEAELEAERLAFSSNNAVGALASPLKFTLNGFRHYSSGLETNAGLMGFIWSSTPGTILVKFLRLSSNNNMSSFFRAAGSSVRCIKN